MKDEIKYFPNGDTSSHMHYINDSLAIFKAFEQLDSSTSKVSFILSYFIVNDSVFQRHGYTYYYHDNGTIANVSKYNFGVMLSSVGYTKSGIVRFKGELKRRGWKETMFYENGNIRHKGRTNGIWKYYYKNGNIQTKGRYSKVIGLDTVSHILIFENCSTSNFVMRNEFFSKTNKVLKTGKWKLYNCKGRKVKNIYFVIENKTLHIQNK